MTYWHDVLPKVPHVIWLPASCVIPAPATKRGWLRPELIAPTNLQRPTCRRGSSAWWRTGREEHWWFIPGNAKCSKGLGYSGLYVTMLVFHYIPPQMFWRKCTYKEIKSFPLSPIFLQLWQFWILVHSFHSVHTRLIKLFTALYFEVFKLVSVVTLMYILFV